MNRNLIKLITLVIFTLIGWFAVYFAKTIYFTSESPKAFPLPTFTDNARSSNPPLIKTVNKELIALSLDEILEVEETWLHRALLSEYLATVPLSELPSLIQSLYDLHPQVSALGNDDKYSIYVGMTVWIKRDFESAKNFVTEKIDSVHKEEDDHVSNYSFYPSLFPAWIKANPEECISYLDKLANEGKSYILNPITRILVNEYPEIAFSVTEKILTTSRFPDLHIYGQIAGQWYEKEPTAALSRVLSMENSEKKELYLNGIIDSMAKTHPEDALVLAKESMQKYDAYASIYKIVSRFSQENKSQALDWIRQGNFSDQERIAAYKAFGGSFSPSQLKSILDDPSFLISEEERINIIRYAFEKSITTESYGNTSVLSSSNFSIYNDSADISIKVELFNELSDSDKIGLIQEIANNAGYHTGILALRLFEQIPHEQKNESMAHYILRTVAFSDPATAIDYYVTKIYEENFENKEILKYPKYSGDSDNIFADLMERFLEDNPNKAKAWAQSLTNETIKTQAMLAILTKDSEKNPIKTLEFLQSSEDLSFAKEVTIKIANKLANNNTQALANFISQITDESWAKEAASSAMQEMASLSENTALDFIDSLSEKPSIQESARLRYISLIKYGSPLKALNAALEISDEKIKEKAISDILPYYERNDPVNAKHWKETNGIASE